MENGRGWHIVPYAHENGTAEYLRPAERVLAHCPGCHQYRTDGITEKDAEEIQKAIQQFAVKYGLLGLMTALSTTPSFMDYEAVYLPKNHFICEESMSIMDYPYLQALFTDLCGKQTECDLP